MKKFGYVALAIGAGCAVAITARAADLAPTQRFEHVCDLSTFPSVYGARLEERSRQGWELLGVETYSAFTAATSARSAVPEVNFLLCYRRPR